MARTEGCPCLPVEACLRPEHRTGGGPRSRKPRHSWRDPSPNLIDALRRIGGNLDVTTVLREVIDSARALTGARYGMIITVDASGQPKEIVASGLTNDEEQRLTSCLPDGPM